MAYYKKSVAVDGSHSYTPIKDSEISKYNINQLIEVPDETVDERLGKIESSVEDMLKVLKEDEDVEKGASPDISYAAGPGTDLATTDHRLPFQSVDQHQSIPGDQAHDNRDPSTNLWNVDARDYSLRNILAAAYGLKSNQEDDELAADPKNNRSLHSEDIKNDSRTDAARGRADARKTAFRRSINEDGYLRKVLAASYGM